MSRQNRLDRRDSPARRSRLLAGGIGGLLALCSAQLFAIQVINGAALAQDGESVRTAVSSLGAKRGTITDATGTILADSVQAYHIAVNQVNITSYVHEDEDGNVVGRGPAEAARQLAPLLQMNEAELGGLMLGESTYSYLKKNVDALTYRKIRQLDITGIEWESVFERIYPNDNTAAPIIGAVNAEGQGVSGLESVYDSLLQGTPGEEAYEISPTGAVMPGGKRTTKEPRDGGSVRTTIHADLQHLVQEKLDARVSRHRADWGVAVITDIATGRLIALADSNSVKPASGKPQLVHAVQSPYEPGSVGKLLTVAAALEKGSVNPTTPFTVPYSINPPNAGGEIKDYHEHGTQAMTTTGILAESSNTGTVAIADTLSDQERYDFMRTMGFGSLTGIELAGESEGILRDVSEWKGRDRYVISFGQAYAITALQQNTMIAAIGNGGVRLNPRIVDSWTSPDGTQHTTDPVQPVQVMSAGRAQELLRMMESVVVEKAGTGQAARVDGYRVAVKTGTADIYVDGHPAVVSNTAGVIPADAPRLAISVVLYNPKAGMLSSDTTAPLFSEVATEAVRNLGIPASSQEAQLYPIAPQAGN